jgi:hypothetical protein
VWASEAGKDPPKQKRGIQAMSVHDLELVRVKGKLRARYGNFIGGRWVEPLEGQWLKLEVTEVALVATSVESS